MDWGAGGASRGGGWSVISNLGRLERTIWRFLVSTPDTLDYQNRFDMKIKNNYLHKKIVPQIATYPTNKKAGAETLLLTILLSTYLKYSDMKIYLSRLSSTPTSPRLSHKPTLFIQAVCWGKSLPQSPCKTTTLVLPANLQRTSVHLYRYAHNYADQIHRLCDDCWVPR